MKNALMIAYDFPPIAKSGVQRTLKFAKFLPLFGWNPIILTVDRSEHLLVASDPSLLSQLPKDSKIYRTKAIEPYDIYKLIGGKKKQGSNEFYFENTGNITGKISNFLGKCLIPDTKIGWYPFSISSAKEVFTRNPIDIIFSTSPKMTAHLIALTLAKKYNKPWVADFRDPWMGWQDSFPTFFKKANEYLESKVVTHADRITTVMEEITLDFRARYNTFEKRKFITIPHGFDSDDLQHVRTKIFSKFTIIYVGTFYKGRDPKPLLEPVSLLLEEHPNLRKDLQLLFIGNDYHYTHTLVDLLNLKDVVISLNQVPYHECLSYLLGASISYFNTVTNRNALPVKLFDYIFTKKPILAIIPEESPSARFIHNTRSGVVLAPHKIDEIKNAIYSFYKDYMKGTLRLTSGPASILNQFERKTQTQQLATNFDDLIL
jgi:glycosyltransferase involved in cell wall biosynthesis